MKIFNHIADQYQKVRAKITYPAELYTKLTSICQFHDSALDIGCGNGVSTINLKAGFQKVVGLDLGEDLIAHARRTYPEIDFIEGAAEDFVTEKKFDLITSATSFYWMNRSHIIHKLPELLVKGGVFCAYKYDFPLPYGELRNFIEYELATKWQPHRDPRLIQYDDTHELLNNSNLFVQTGQFIIPNIIELTPAEIAEFFLSTSYVSKYIASKDHLYPDNFRVQCQQQGGQLPVKIRFDIYASYAIL